MLHVFPSNDFENLFGSYSTPFTLGIVNRCQTGLNILRQLDIIKADDMNILANRQL
ncbi:hypothetical protein D3C78_1881580 [compost metagenome]